jgi:hypothetical protein
MSLSQPGATRTRRAAIVAVAVMTCSIWVVGSPSICRADAPEPIVLETTPGKARPIVSMALNGEGPFRFFVDTGAGGNVVSASLAERLGLERVGTQRIFNPTAGAVSEADLVTVAVAEAGALRLENVQFVAADMPQLGDCDGVLSIRSLPPGLVTFDFTAGTIRIEPGVLEEDGAGVMPCELAPVVSVAGEVDGRPLVFRVDTGSPDGITLPGNLARELAFDGELVTVRERGPLVVRSGRLRGTVHIGHMVLENPEVQVVDLFTDFGNIGSRFLQDKVLTIDRSRELLRVTSPAEARGGSQD